MIVISIILILAAILIPAYKRAAEKVKEEKAKETQATEAAKTPKYDSTAEPYPGFQQEEPYPGYKEKNKALEPKEILKKVEIRYEFEYWFYLGDEKWVKVSESVFNAYKEGEIFPKIKPEKE